MKCVEPTELEATPTLQTCELKLPMGILGFEKIKDYLLIANPDEEPFRWLQVKGDINLAFVVVEPFVVAPDYHPDIPQPDVEFLGLSEPEDAILFSIVTLHGANRATINLKGPLVVNRHTGVGKQVIIANASQYSVEHPLSLAEVVA